jgi:hypothetical protein
MPKYEVCEIAEQEMRKSQSGILNKVTTIVFKTVARVDTPSGYKIITETNEYESFQYSHSDDALDKRRAREVAKAIENESKLVRQLIADGWEPVLYSQYGSVKTLRRPISGT